MDLDALPTSLLPRATLGELSQRSDARGGRQLTVHLGLLAASGCLVWASRGHVWLAAALLLHGIVLCFLFCALHECIHRTAFASRALNDAIAWACGALLILPPNYFRLFHFAHHRYTQDRARDPELATASPATLAAYLWRVSGLPGIVVLSLYLHSAAAVIYWLVPAMLGEPFVRLFLLAEHTGCAFDEDMLANTRTTYTNPAVLLLTWRMPYHAEHHSFPSVPFHALVRVNKLLPAAGRVTSRGYVAWHRALLRQLRAAAH
jgi:fatty acid desaturase